MKWQVEGNKVGLWFSTSISKYLKKKEILRKLKKEHFYEAVSIYSLNPQIHKILTAEINQAPGRFKCGKCTARAHIYWVFSLENIKSYNWTTLIRAFQVPVLVPQWLIICHHIKSLNFNIQHAQSERKTRHLW